MKRTQLAAAVLLATGSVSAMAATYSVTPLPLKDISLNNFARSIDNSGQMLSVVQREFSPPVDVDQLENDTTFFSQFGESLENEDDVLQGIFTDADYTIVVNFLSGTTDATQGQKLALQRTYLSDTQDFSLVPGLDVITDKFDDYTFSVETTGRDSVGGDYIVGDSDGLVVLDPYENENGDTINYTYANSNQQAFVQVGSETKRLAPADETLGGYGSARSINDNLQVAGFSSVSFLDIVDDAVENCADPEVRTDISEGRCRYNIYRGELNVPRIDSYFVNVSTNSRPFSSYLLASEVNATVWQLDVTGDVISTETFPLLFEPEEDDTNHYYSFAYSINNQGIAVGEALTGDRITITRPNSTGQLENERVATVYRDGETIELLPRDENILSQAIAINDNNWVAGAVLRSRSDIARSRLFAFNLDTQEQFYPEGLFISGGVTPNAINNNNIIVGKADSEATADTIRQTAGFMFNIDTQEFTNLNDLLPCDSEYEVLEAVDINDNNEIIANARVKRTTKYATGVEIINSDGETELVDNIIAVKLSPLANGEVEQCELSEDEQPYERQGASSSWFGLLALLGAVFVRRRMKR